jgi:hypothetical protein
VSDGRRSFLTGLIDYAGLFPPAALDMRAAAAQYARHRGEPESWMLGRFIAPAGRLDDVVAAAAPYVDGGAWPLSALVGAREGIAATVAALPAQAAAVIMAETSGVVTVPALECVLPAEPAAAQLLATLVAVGLTGREVYCEAPAGADDEGLLADLAAAAAPHESAFPRLGAKLRCGGVTPDAFPSCERVAAVITGCRDLQLPLKCTAGLHHPVRRRADEPDVMMHGFLNVFGAALLAHVCGLGGDELTACVAETDPAAFRLDAAGFAWGGHAVAATDIAALRGGMLCGFGSCSFDEPREDLAALGLL